jgi:xylulokinase
MLGGPDHMAARVGTCANSSLVAAQMLRVRETSPETWARTGRVQIASAFLASLISGTWISMGEAEACATGMYVYASGGQGHWDNEVIEYIAGSTEEAWRVRGWLGDVDVSGGGRRVATVSRYLVDRYGFEPGESAIVESQEDLLLNLSKIPQSPHSLPTTYRHIFPLYLRPPMPSSRSAPWIFFLPVPPTTFPAGFTVSTHTLLRIRVRNGNTSAC